MKKNIKELAKKFNGIDTKAIEEIFKVGHLEGYLKGIFEERSKQSKEQKEQECAEINIPQWYREFMTRG